MMPILLPVLVRRSVRATTVPATRPAPAPAFTARVNSDHDCTRSRLSAATVPSSFDPTLALKPSAHAHCNQQVHGSLFENARSHAFDDVVAASVFDNDRIDSVEMKQMAQKKSCRTCADDSYLCFHGTMFTLRIAGFNSRSKCTGGRPGATPEDRRQENRLRQAAKPTGPVVTALRSS